MSGIQYGVSRGEVPPYPKLNVRGYGHSIAVGASASRVGTTNFYARLQNTLDPARYTMSYTGHGSYSTYSLLPLVAADVDAFLDPDKINLFLYMEVINSVNQYMQAGGLAAGPASVAAIADHRTMFEGRRAAGWDRIVTCTMYPMQFWPSDYVDCCMLINDGLRVMRDEGLIDELVEVAQHPKFLSPISTDVINPGDLVHPLDYGHQLIADMFRPAIYRMYEKYGPANTWSPHDIGEMVWWYEADPSLVTYDSSNLISLVKDKSSWAYDLAAVSPVQPTWNPHNAAFGSKPTIDGAGAGACLTSQLDVNLSYTKALEIMSLYRCTNPSVAIMAEFSEAADLYTDTFQIARHNYGTGPEIQSFGNVGNSRAFASDPAGPKCVSLVMDHSAGSNQGNILVEGSAAAGLTRVDAPNTNKFGTRKLNLFARQGRVFPATMSLAMQIAFSKQLSSSDRTKLLAYAAAKWPH